MNCAFDPTAHPNPFRKIKCPGCGKDIVTGINHLPEARTSTMTRMLELLDARPEAPHPCPAEKVEAYRKAMEVYVAHRDRYVIAITYGSSYDHRKH